jgi:hypothetical protein
MSSMRLNAIRATTDVVSGILNWVCPKFCLGEACLLLMPCSVRDAIQDEFLCQIGSGSLAGSD